MFFSLFFHFIYAQGEALLLTTRYQKYDTTFIVFTASQNFDLNLVISTEMFYDNNINNITCGKSNEPNIKFSQYTSIDSLPYSYEISSINEPYKIYVYGCLSAFPDDFSIEFYFDNDWGYLNPELFPIMIISFIEALYYLIVLILWLINRHHHPLIVTKLNAIFVFVSAIMVIGSALGGLMLFFINTVVKFAVDSLVLNIFSDIFKTCRFMALLVLTLYIASGVSIVHDSIELRFHIIIYAFSFLFSCVEFISSLSFSLIFETTSIAFIISLAVLLVLFYMIFAFIFTSWCTKAMRILGLHLYAIREAGIDPLTTPSYKKYEMLKKVRILALFLFVIELLSCIVYNSMNSSFWVVYLILSIIQAIVFGILCYLCRARRAMASTYFDDESAYIVSDDSLPPTNEADQENATHNLQRWEFGKPLPPMPTGEDLTRIHGYVSGEDDQSEHANPK